MLMGKIVLLVSAIAFVSYGLLSLFSPAIPAGFAGLLMTSGDAYAEIGAMYGGLQTGLGLLCAFAIIKPDLYRSGLMLLVIAIGSLTLARLFSILTAPDSVTAYSQGALAYELATTLLALAALVKAPR